MTVGGVSDATFSRIIGVVKQHPGVKTLYLFGSRARGDFRYNSDIDLAYISDGAVSPEFYLDLDEAAGIYSFDLIDLNDCPPELREQVIRDRVVLYERQ